VRRILDAPLWGLTHVVRHAASRIAQRSITFTSGSLSSCPRPGIAMLTAMLSGVEALAPEPSVRVKAVTLGLIDTPLPTPPTARSGTRSSRTGPLSYREDASARRTR
jgi:hypothetical protein